MNNEELNEVISLFKNCISYFYFNKDRDGVDLTTYIVELKDINIEEVNIAFTKYYGEMYFDLDSKYEYIYPNQEIKQILTRATCLLSMSDYIIENILSPILYGLNVDCVDYSRVANTKRFVRCFNLKSPSLDAIDSFYNLKDNPDIEIVSYLYPYIELVLDKLDNFTNINIIRIMFAIIRACQLKRYYSIFLEILTYHEDTLSNKILTDFHRY